MTLFLSIAAAIVMASLLFRVFFSDWDDFLECVRFYFTPDLISAFRGEWLEDQVGQFKLGIYAVICIGTGVAVYWKLGG